MLFRVLAVTFTSALLYGSVAYLTARPGAAKNDTTILPKTFQACPY